MQQDFYSTAIRTLERLILRADPASDGCTTLSNLRTQMQIKQNGRTDEEVHMREYRKPKTLAEAEEQLQYYQLLGDALRNRLQTAKIEIHNMTGFDMIFDQLKQVDALVKLSAFNVQRFRAEQE